jgi:RimJ/RimL family protein N-acetyltransferase
VACRYRGSCDGFLWDAPTDGDTPSSWVERTHGRWKQGLGYSFVARDTASLEFVGQLTIVPVDPRRRGLLGCWVHPLRTNRGFATEIARAGVAFAFEQLAVREVSAYHTGGTAGRRVLEKIGMSIAHDVPEGFRREGQWVRVSEFAVSEPDWRSAGAQHQTQVGAALKPSAVHELKGSKELIIAC